MADSGIEGAADRIGDATRFVKQAHTMLRRLLEAEGEGDLLAARIAPGVRLTLERLAHLETCVNYLRDALRDQLPGRVSITAAQREELHRGYSEARDKAMAEFDRMHPDDHCSDVEPTALVLDEIEQEREHQIEMHYTASVDDGQRNGQLVRCAAAYALAGYPPGASEIIVKQTVTEGQRTNLIMPAQEIAHALWPGNPGRFHPAHNMDPAEVEARGAAGAPVRRHDLVRAAALLVAEIERIDRTAKRGEPDSIMAPPSAEAGQ